jgi:uncharacterized membrane protein
MWYESHAITINQLEVYSMQVQALGILWFKDASQYHEYKKIFTDSKVLSNNYTDWLRDAEKIVKRYENSGSTVIKAYAEPSEFLKWCSANGETIDSKGRMAFANAKAYEYLVSKN